MWKITYLNDARILCRSTVTIYDKSLFVIVSRIDSENCKKKDLFRVLLLLVEMFVVVIRKMCHLTLV